MAESHFSRLLNCLDHEAAAEAEEVARLSRRKDGEAAEVGGACLVGLVIRDEVSGFGGRVVLTLGKRDRESELPWTRLNHGSPIVLSEEKVSESVACRGVITERNRETITVALSQSPEPIADRPTFRVDLSLDEVSRQRQREALRRADSASSGRLAVLKRKLLGEELPEFKAAPIWQPLSALDDSQIAAVSHALSAEDFAIIHGPPGTGKTTTVVELIRQAVRRGDRVLACAPSNLAVDNMLERLIAGDERAIRIGHPARVLPELREHTLDVQVESHPDLKLAREWTKQAWALRRQASKYTRSAPPSGMRRDLREEAKQLLNDARLMESRLVEHLLDSATIVCATLTGLDNELLRDREFDLVVIDEAAQATEPPCWIPLLRSRRLVLAGDHCQLPPTVRSSEARQADFHVSLMERLLALKHQHGVPASGPDRRSRKNAEKSLSNTRVESVIYESVLERPTPILDPKTDVTRLTIQYRMNEQIMKFSSDEFYKSSLIAAESVCGHLLSDLPNVVPCSLTQTSIRFIDTAGSSCDERAEVDGSSRDNPGEAEHVARLVGDLVNARVPISDIAVISPYSAQVRLLRQLLPDVSLEIDTVDGFQGREKEAIVISLVRSNLTGELGFLADTRRMNVALTRARRKLLVIGDSSTLANHPFYLRLLNYFEHEGAYGTVWDVYDESHEQPTSP